MSLLGQLRRWRARRLHATANDSLQIEIGEHELSRPRLLGQSRCGRLSWTARLDDQPVKILECHDTEHARFLEQLSTHPRLGRHFPEPVLRAGPFLLVRWIDGEVVRWGRDRRLVPAVAGLQAQLHLERSVPELPAGSFSYLEFLEERWRRYQSVFPLAEGFEGIRSVLDGQRPQLATALCHPDLTAANLVVERSTGRIKVIDNELLGLGVYHPVDLLATFRSFGAGLRRQLAPVYAEAYAAAGGDLGALTANQDYFQALWLLARIGALLQEGAIGHATELAHSWQRDSYRGPELFELAARQIS